MSSVRQHCDISEPKSWFPQLEGTATTGCARKWGTLCWYLRIFIVLPTLSWGSVIKIREDGIASREVATIIKTVC